MNRDTVRAMLKALPDTREDGNSVLFDPSWEVSMHAGPHGAPVNVQQLTRITVEQEFVAAETHKGQRVVLAIGEVRGFTAEPSSADRKGRKTGFV
jgi:hypothetical protein